MKNLEELTDELARLNGFSEQTISLMRHHRKLMKYALKQRGDSI